MNISKIDDALDLAHRCNIIQSVGSYGVSMPQGYDMQSLVTALKVLAEAYQEEKGKAEGARQALRSVEKNMRITS